MSTYNVFYFKSVIDRSGSPISVFRDRAVFSGSLEDVLSKAYDSFYPGDVYATISDRNTEATVARLQSDGMATILSDKYGMDEGQVQVERIQQPEPIFEQPKKRFMGLFDDGGEVELLAPNGKRSNLSPEQYRLVRTPEFKAFFGDWENDPENASKVVDENGEPLVVYHGSPKKFTIFKGGIYWFTNQSRISKEYGNKIYACFLNVRKPFEITPLSGYEFQKDKEDEGGYYDNLPININWVVKNPTQIKLADGRNTTFDARNPDIRFADGGQLSMNFDQTTFEHGGEILGVTLDEAVLLYIKRGIKPAYRENYLKAAGMYNTDKLNQVENSLKKKGYLNAAGSINELGKQKAKEVDEKLNYKISRNFLSALNKEKAYNELKDKFTSNFENSGYMAKGGQTPREKLEVELRRLQRELISPRLSTYREGDVSEERAAIKRERESKLARFNEILEILREDENKMASGGYMAKGGQINDFHVIVRTNKGLVRKDDFEGMSKNKIIEWCEQRGWEYNGKGEKMGGRVLQEWEFFVMPNKRYDVKLPSKKRVSPGGYMAKGGVIKVGNKFGDWSVTQYKPIIYEDAGGTRDGIVKLVNQNTFDEIIIQYDGALRNPKWFARNKGVRVEGKSPKEVIEKLKLESFKMGGKVTFAEKVKAIKKSLLKRKKVSPKVQKDYGKTYSPKEAEESAKRIAGAMTAKERVKARLQKRKK